MLHKTLPIGGGERGGDALETNCAVRTVYTTWRIVDLLKRARVKDAYLLRGEHVEIAVGGGLVLGEEVEVREIQVHRAARGNESVQLQQAHICG